MLVTCKYSTNASLVITFHIMSIWIKILMPEQFQAQFPPSTLGWETFVGKTFAGLIFMSFNFRHTQLLSVCTHTK